MAEPFERATLGRLRVHVLPTKRFKTFACALYAGVPLNEQTVTSTALLPFVLRRGTSRLPETIAFRERLDDLYGAGFGFDLNKRGDFQIIQFKLDMINDRFVSSSESLLKEALRFLGDVATDPALEEGAFRRKYVEAEKTTVAKRIDAIINDKIRYAAERCVEEMCAEEPYGLLALGKKEELAALTPQSLAEAYRKWLNEAVFDLYVAGDTTLSEVLEMAAEAFRLPDGNAGVYGKVRLVPAREEPRTIIERMDVGQGKLNMGLRVGTTYGDPEYAALLVYNGLLGAFPHSKLFVNVREKASLAYYASSRVDGHKGLMTIQSGIEIPNFERAVTIIREQLDAMRSGQFAAEDVARTKAMLGGQLRELQDSAFERIGFDFNAILAGVERSSESLLADIEAVKDEAIVASAESVRLDTIYFLRDRKEEAKA